MIGNLKARTITRNIAFWEVPGIPRGEESKTMTCHCANQRQKSTVRNQVLVLAFVEECGVGGVTRHVPICRACDNG